MNILEMHIMLDMFINKVNSNVWGTINNPEKDNFINEAIRNYVRSEMYPNTNKDEVDAIAISDKLHTLICSKETFTLTDYPLPYTKSIDLLSIGNNSESPKYISKIFDKIISGTTYKLLRLYSGDDFAVYNNSISISENESFTAKWQVSNSRQPTFQSDTYLSYEYDKITNQNNTLLCGIDYKVLSGLITFTPVQLSSFGVTINGTKYTSLISNSNITCTVGDTFRIHDTKSSNGWTNGSILEVVNESNDYFALISSSSKVSYSCANSLQTKISKNRLLRRSDVDTVNQYGLSTSSDSPISFLENNKLLIKYTDNTKVPLSKQFSLVSVYITYYKKPRVVDLSGGVSCDLPEIAHDMVIRNCAETILTSINNGSFEKLRADNAKLLLK